MCPVCVYVSIVLAEQCLLQSTPLCITTEYVLTTIMSGSYCGSFHILLLYLYKEVCMIHPENPTDLRPNAAFACRCHWLDGMYEM